MMEVDGCQEDSVNVNADWDFSNKVMSLLALQPSYNSKETSINTSQKVQYLLEEEEEEEEGSELWTMPSRLLL